MFIQVIQGRAKDATAIRAGFERWREELAPGAAGWLGTTAGVADDGEFIALARFESEAAARGNSDRPEQGAWWQRIAAQLEGGATFHDCPRVDVVLDRGADAAGFVQVVQGRALDFAKLRQLGLDGEALVRDQALHVLGMAIAEHAGGEGGFTQAVYFTSEEDARAAERAMPPDIAAQLEEVRSLTAEVRFIDLRDPWLFSVEGIGGGGGE